MNVAFVPQTAEDRETKSRGAWTIKHHYERTTGGEWWLVTRSVGAAREVLANERGNFKRFRSLAAAERAIAAADK